MNSRLIKETVVFNHWYIERILSLATLVLFIYIFITCSISSSLYFLLKFVVFLHVYFGLKGRETLIQKSPYLVNYPAA